MLSQLKGTPRACTLFFLPLLTLAFPLGVLLVVLQRLPVEEVQLASTDTRLLSPVSTFWCAAQEVTSGHPFFAYKVPRTPPILREPPNVHTLSFRFNLLRGKHHLLRYHLLTGSTLEIGGCTSRWPAPFEIFYGEQSLALCQSQTAVQTPPQAPPLVQSPEESSSEEESQESDEVLPVNSGKDLIRRHSSWSSPRSNDCQDSSLLFGQLDTAPTAEEPAPSCPLGRFPFRFNVSRTGKYYVLVRTDDAPEPGGVLLHVRLNRTTYELPESVLLCRSPSACAIPLTFGAEERVVVFVSAEPDAGAALFPVRSKCQPRPAFYLVVFLLLPLLFALALLYVVRSQRKKRRRLTARPEVRPEEGEPEENVLLKEVRFGQPPSYSDALIGQSSVTQLPPPYEDCEDRPLQNSARDWLPSVHGLVSPSGQG